MGQAVIHANAMGRLNNFGSLRIFFALLVIVSHSPEMVDGNRSRELLTFVFGTLSFGDLAVDGFFLISGYLIFRSFENSRNILIYLKKRILRIYPAFIVAYLTTYFVVAPIAGGTLSVSNLPEDLAKMLLLRLPFVPDAFQGLHYPSLNGSMWTVFYEFLCYLITIPIGILIASNQKSTYSFVFLTLLAVYLSREFIASVGPTMGRFIDFLELARLLFMFCVGSGFYIFRHQIRYTNQGALISLICLTLIFFSESLAEIALAVFGGYILFWYAFACRPNAISRLSEKIDPSYGIYLFACPIQNLLIYYHPGISPWTVTLVTIPLSIMFGIASWLLVEEPALRLKTSSARREASEPA